MPIWIDADACPKVCRELLYRASARTATMLYFVSNHALPLPLSPLIRSIRVEAGFDQADAKIAATIQAGELLVTQDIPLAATVIAKGAVVLTPRGEQLTSLNIAERLVLRDLQEELRQSGIQTQGPSPLSPKEKQYFANALEQWLRQQG